MATNELFLYKKTPFLIKSSKKKYLKNTLMPKLKNHSESAWTFSEHFIKICQ